MYNDTLVQCKSNIATTLCDGITVPLCDCITHLFLCGNITSFCMRDDSHALLKTNELFVL